MASDRQEPGDYHYHQKPVYTHAQLTGWQELYNWRPPEDGNYIC